MIFIYIEKSLSGRVFRHLFQSHAGVGINRWPNSRTLGVIPPPLHETFPISCTENSFCVILLEKVNYGPVFVVVVVCDSLKDNLNLIVSYTSESHHHQRHYILCRHRWETLGKKALQNFIFLPIVCLTQITFSLVRPFPSSSLKLFNNTFIFTLKPTWSRCSFYNLFNPY